MTSSYETIFREIDDIADRLDSMNILEDVFESKTVDMNVLSSKLKGLNSLKEKLQGIDVDVEDPDEKKKLKEMIHQTLLPIDTLINDVNEIQKLKMDASLKFKLVKEIANPILSKMENILDDTNDSASLQLYDLSRTIFINIGREVDILESGAKYLELEEIKELYELKGRIQRIDEGLNKYVEDYESKYRQSTMETEILEDIILIQHRFILLYDVSQSAVRMSSDDLNFWKTDAEKIKSRISNVKKTIRENNLNSLFILEDTLNNIEKLFLGVDERLSITPDDDSD